MLFFQRELELPPLPRGFHLITDRVGQAIPELRRFDSGLLHVFIKHTSASLTVSENTDPAVRHDFESYFNRLVPENAPYYLHTDEGSDDMPAHLKAAMLGSSVVLPITAGRLNLGAWQGIYLCEHRNRADARRLVLTASGV